MAVIVGLRVVVIEWVAWGLRCVCVGIWSLVHLAKTCGDLAKRRSVLPRKWFIKCLWGSICSFVGQSHKRRKNLWLFLCFIEHWCRWPAIVVIVAVSSVIGITVTYAIIRHIVVLPIVIVVKSAIFFYFRFIFLVSEWVLLFGAIRRVLRETRWDFVQESRRFLDEERWLLERRWVFDEGSRFRQIGRLNGVSERVEYCIYLLITFRVLTTVVGEPS